MMEQGASAAVPEGMTLSDVYEEAFDEAAYYCEVLDAAFDDAEYTLSSLARGPEAKLRGMLEVLAVDATADREELCAALASAEPATQHRAQAAAMALLLVGDPKSLIEAVMHEQPAVRAAAVSAVSLAEDQQVLDAISKKLAAASDPSQAARCLQLLSACHTPPPSSLGTWLDSEDSVALARALETARAADPERYVHLVERRLRHPDAAVRTAALTTGMIYQSRDAFLACEEAATVDGTAMLLYAAVGGPAEHRRLEALLGSEVTRKDAIFALGFSGNADIVPVLLEFLGSDDPIVAKLAFEAISTIAGLDTNDDAYALPTDKAETSGTLPPVDEDPEALAALPPLEQDQDLPLREPVEDLPQPNPESIAAWWSQRGAAYSKNVRYLGGQPLSVATWTHFLTHAPLRRRHVVELSLRIRSRGAFHFDTRAWSHVQLRAIAKLPALQARQLANPFSTFS